jgi:hypothetical protein
VHDVRPATPHCPCEPHRRQWSARVNALRDWAARVRLDVSDGRAELGWGILRETVSRSNVRAMTTFVLVHGAWGGSYGFKYVRGPLREAGHEVFTP